VRSRAAEPGTCPTPRATKFAISRTAPRWL
jgi:hypothetical protein